MPSQGTGTFSTEATNFASVLKIQRTIFRASVRGLLALCVGQDHAVDMLDDLHNINWSDDAVERSLVRILGECHDPVVDSIRLIEAELSDLERDTQSFEEAMTAMPEHEVGYPNLPGCDSLFAKVLHQCERTDRKKWCRKVGKKIKFAFSETHFQDSISRLRALTQDFRMLIAQAGPSEQKRPDLRPSAASCMEIAKFTHIKTAAQNLYEALGSACTKHTEHQAHFSLQPAWNGCQPQVRFSISFRQLAISRHEPADQPMWFAVESVITGSIKRAPIGKPGMLSDINQSMKHGRMSCSPPPSQQRSGKMVRFPSPSPPPTPPKLISAGPALQNLCTHNNFCNQLQNFLSQSTSAMGSNCCIGFLEHLGNSKHLVYLDDRAQLISTGTTSTSLVSLKEIFSTMSKRNSEDAGLSLLMRIQLARQLARAVLQFHATPWLKSSWCSNDIFLYGMDSSALNAGSKVNSPYLNVSVRGPHEPVAHVATFPDRTLIRNRFLFGLGIMLLELAFEAPLRSLRKAADVDIYEGRNTDYYTADRVRLGTGRLLGPRYAELVRKCIQCDFGRGSDLNDAALQEGFYREVVCELEGLEEQFRKLNLDT